MRIGKFLIFNCKKIDVSSYNTESKILTLYLKSKKQELEYKKSNKIYTKYRIPTIYQYILIPIDTFLNKFLKKVGIIKSKLIEAKEIVPIKEQCDYTCEYKIEENFDMNKMNYK